MAQREFRIGLSGAEYMSSFTVPGLIASVSVYYKDKSPHAVCGECTNGLHKQTYILYTSDAPGVIYLKSSKREHK